MKTMTMREAKEYIIKMRPPMTNYDEMWNYLLDNDSKLEEQYHLRSDHAKIIYHSLKEKI